MDTTEQAYPWAYHLQREAQEEAARRQVLRLARTLSTAPREDVSPAVGAGLDALQAAFAALDFWSLPT